MCSRKYWVGQKVRLVFSIRWLSWCLGVFNFIQNHFVRLYCDSCHISEHLKKLIKISEILSGHFNIEDERKEAMFSAYYALLFQER